MIGGYLLDIVPFTYRYYRYFLEKALDNGYRIVNLHDYFLNRYEGKIIILRDDVDLSPESAARIAQIENEFSIHSTYFIRVHTDSYNPFGYKAYPSLKKLVELGCEVGLHYEVMDFSNITGEDPENIFLRERSILEDIFNVKIEGVCAHGDYSYIDNKLFWKDRDLQDFDLSYSATDELFFDDAVYVSDVHRKWRDGKDICKIVEENVQKIYACTHPCYWCEGQYHMRNIKYQ